MDRDLERRLRESLRARAVDVQPDPETWTRVRTRLVRQRILRWVSTGLAAAATAALVAFVVVPQVRPLARIDLEGNQQVDAPPGEAGPELPLAGPSEEAGEGVGGALYGSDGLMLKVVGLDGTVLQETARADDSRFCAAPDCTGPFAHPSITTSPGSTVERFGDVRVLDVGECGVLRSSVRLAREVAEFQIELPDGRCPSGATFSPDGRYLAWAEHGPGFEDPELHIARYTEPAVDRSQEVVVPISGRMSAILDLQDWFWTDEGAGFLVVQSLVDGGPQVALLRIGQDSGRGLEIGVPSWTELQGVVAAAVGGAEANTEFRMVRSSDGLALEAVPNGRGRPEGLPLPFSTPEDQTRPYPWVKARGSAVVVGDGRGGVWVTHWSGDGFAPLRELGEAVVTGDLLADEPAPQTDPDR